MWWTCLQAYVVGLQFVLCREHVEGLRCVMNMLKGYVIGLQNVVNMFEGIML